MQPKQISPETLLTVSTASHSSVKEERPDGVKKQSEQKNETKTIIVLSPEFVPCEHL